MLHNLPCSIATLTAKNRLSTARLVYMQALGKLSSGCKCYSVKNVFSGHFLNFPVDVTVFYSCKRALRQMASPSIMVGGLIKEWNCPSYLINICDRIIMDKLQLLCFFLLPIGCTFAMTHKTLLVCGFLTLQPSCFLPSVWSPVLSQTLTKPAVVGWGINACLHLGMRDWQ